MRICLSLFLTLAPAYGFVVTQNGRVRPAALFATSLESLSVPELKDMVKEQYSGSIMGKMRQDRVLKKLTMKQDLIDFLDSKGVKGPESATTSLAEVVSEETDLKSFDKVQEIFPNSLSNADLATFITSTLSAKGYDDGKTLVATSLCCDEVNRPLESDLREIYDTNFNMGGLAGFPFGGATSFGAMAAHIPDGGSCLVVYGPHVGVDSTGAVGTVERRGRANGGSCCGSAVAASGYVGSVFKGDAEEAALPEDALDAQQYFVGSMLMPYAERLDAAEEKMKELPYALYDAQTELMGRIVEKSGGAVADGTTAVLGGIQINTPPGYSDYFLPLSFKLHDNEGKEVEDIMWA
mmetsp:Transcript_7829/g.11581  ORF Transcript_7829/g.11581 Transcript_7829/m.11581 type:complete len:351 (-) Transcript_7829:206-1258(-)